MDRFKTHGLITTQDVNGTYFAKVNNFLSFNVAAEQVTISPKIVSSPIVYLVLAKENK